MATQSNPNGWLGDFGNALVHHLVNPVYGAFQAWDNALTGGLQAIAPNSSLANWSAGQTAVFNNAVTNRENSYQSQVPDNTASMTGAFLGDLLPWMGGPLLGSLSRAGDAVASLPAISRIPLGPLFAREGTMGILSALPQPLDNTSNYWGDKAAQMGQWGLLGSVAAPMAGGMSYIPEATSALSKFGQYAPVAQPLLGGLGL